jgi:uncharacterized membrane protein YdbT with pleckstrin-like domain
MNEEIQNLYICPSFLLPKEEIIWQTNPHWLFLVIPEIALLLVGIFVVKHLSFTNQIFQSLTILFEIAIAFSMVVLFLNWICTKYYLTNIRLVEERGIIGKRIMSIWLDKIQDITVKFSIFGRIFNFGDIEIESAGTQGKIVFDSLPNPRKRAEDIESLRLKMKT